MGYSNYNTAVDTETKTVKFNYTAKDNAKNILILENKVNKEFVPVSTAVLGKIGNNTAEVQSPIQVDWGVLGGLGPYAGITDLKSIRWQNEGMEYAIIGNDSLEVMIEFIKSLKMGDYPIKYEELKIVQNTAIEAIIEVNDTKTSISKVFLKKLIRKDNTGIWTVVGYDVKK